MKHKITFSKDGTMWSAEPSKKPAWSSFSGLPEHLHKPMLHSLPRKPARDPMVIATEKAYRASNQYQIDKLLKLEKRYARRLKLAEAGLAKTRRQIRSLLTELAKQRLAERSQ